MNVDPRQVYESCLKSVEFESRYGELCESFVTRDASYTPEKDLVLQALEDRCYTAKYISGEGGYYKVDAWKRLDVELNLKIDPKFGVFKTLEGCLVQGKPIGLGFSREYAALEKQRERKKYLESVGKFYNVQAAKFSNFEDFKSILDVYLPIYEELKKVLILKYSDLGLC